MNFEATRTLRRLIRFNGEANRGMSATIVLLILLLYAWILATILSSRDDMSIPLLLSELVVLSLVVPASMYAAISGERERLTWDALILTRLSAGRILAGKLLWRLVLIAGTLALFAVPIFLGHAMAVYRPEFATTALVEAQAVVAAWSIFLAAFSLWVSAKTRRSVTSLSLVAAALLAFTVLVPIVVALFGGEVAIPAFADVSPMERLGSLLVHLHPMCGVMPSGAWMGPSGENDALLKAGWIAVLPAIYLLGAAVCLAGTLKALRRLGMPNRLSR
jgi:hypothetical protein